MPREAEGVYGNCGFTGLFSFCLYPAALRCRPVRTGEYGLFLISISLLRSALLDALCAFLLAEKERVVHAQQNFNNKETRTWNDELNPYVTDKDRSVHIPEFWDGSAVVLGTA
jgi:hypothetical protein